MNPNKVDVGKFFGKFKNGTLTIPAQPTEIVQICLHCKKNSGDEGVSPGDFCSMHNMPECRLGTVKKGPAGTFEAVSIGDFVDA